MGQAGSEQARYEVSHKESGSGRDSTCLLDGMVPVSEALFVRGGAASPVSLIDVVL